MRFRCVLFALVATGCVTSELEPEIVLDEPEPSATGNLGVDIELAQLDGSALRESIDAGGRAYGLTVLVGGTTVVPATPHASESSAPGPVATAPANAYVTATALTATHQNEVTLSRSSSASRSSASHVVVSITGLRLTASEVVANVSAAASNQSISTSIAGSVIHDLVINGVRYGTQTTPQVVAIPGVGEVGLLARPAIKDGVAAAAIRIRLVDQPLTPVDETAEVTISYAEAWAAYPQSQ